MARTKRTRRRHRSRFGCNGNRSADVRPNFEPGEDGDDKLKRPYASILSELLLEPFHLGLYFRGGVVPCCTT